MIYTPFVMAAVSSLHTSLLRHPLPLVIFFLFNIWLKKHPKKTWYSTWNRSDLLLNLASCYTNKNSSEFSFSMTLMLQWLLFCFVEFMFICVFMQSALILLIWPFTMALLLFLLHLSLGRTNPELLSCPRSPSPGEIQNIHSWSVRSQLLYCAVGSECLLVGCMPGWDWLERSFPVSLCNTCALGQMCWEIWGFYLPSAILLFSLLGSK